VTGGVDVDQLLGRRHLPPDTPSLLPMERVDVADSPADRVVASRGCGPDIEGSHPPECHGSGAISVVRAGEGRLATPRDPCSSSRAWRAGRRSTDGNRLAVYATDVDRLVYKEALAVFLCAPQALYAVNKNVEGAATFERAETWVNAQHWSRR
jgi:hypothetical protein